MVPLGRGKRMKKQVSGWDLGTILGLGIISGHAFTRGFLINKPPAGFFFGIMGTLFLSVAIFNISLMILSAKHEKEE